MKRLILIAVAALMACSPGNAAAQQAEAQTPARQPGCAGQSVSHSITGSDFDLRAQESSKMVCDIGVPPEVPQVWSALQAAETIARAEAGAVLLSGGGRSVRLAPR